MTSRFEGQTLTVDWSQAIGHECSLELKGWNDGLSATVIRGAEIEPISLTEIGDWLFEVDDLAVGRWKQTLPKQIQKGLDAIPSHRSKAIALATAHDKAFDLLATNPLLVWLLIERGVVDDQNSEQLNHLLCDKQANLCALVGLNGRKQEVKLLKRASSLKLRKDELESFSELLEVPAVCDYLSHQKTMSPAALKLLRTNQWLVLSKARALIPSLCQPEFRRIFDDVLRMIENVFQLQHCATTASLQRLHDNLVDELNESRGAKLIRDQMGNPKPIPPAPLQSAYSIEPITEQIGLIKEGREMRHCIASHLFSVVSGDYAVYRMLEPERLTIEIVMTAWGQCFLKEVRGKGNRLPNATSMQIIEKWFLEFQPSTSDGLPMIPTPLEPLPRRAN